MQQIYPQVQEKGGRLIVFTPQLPEHSTKLAQEQRLTFPLVHDTDLALAEELRLVFDFPEDLAAIYQKFGLDVPSSNGNSRWSLPMAARYLVDQNGLIRDAAINPDYTRRPEPAEMLDLLAMLA